MSSHHTTIPPSSPSHIVLFNQSLPPLTFYYQFSCLVFPACLPVCLFASSVCLPQVPPRPFSDQPPPSDEPSYHPRIRYRLPDGRYLTEDDISQHQYVPPEIVPKHSPQKVPPNPPAPTTPTTSTPFLSILLIKTK